MGTHSVWVFVVELLWGSGEADESSTLPQSFHVWMHQLIHPKAKLCYAQRTRNNSKSYTSQMSMLQA